MVEIIKVTNRIEEPKSMYTGVWKNGRVNRVWREGLKGAEVPNELRGKIRSLFERRPENIDTNGDGKVNYFRYKDIVEVSFEGVNDAHGGIEVLGADKYRMFRGKEKEQRAKSTWEQIFELTAERGRPKIIYWERVEHIVENGVRTRDEHVEISLPFEGVEADLVDIAQKTRPLQYGGKSFERIIDDIKGRNQQEEQNKGESGKSGPKKKSAGKVQEASMSETVGIAPILSALDDPDNLSSLKIVSQTKYSRCFGIKDALVFNKNKTVGKREGK